jgi:hypothetical protein
MSDELVTKLHRCDIACGAEELRWTAYDTDKNHDYVMLSIPLFNHSLYNWTAF